MTKALFSIVLLLFPVCVSSMQVVSAKKRLDKKSFLHKQATALTRPDASASTSSHGTLSTTHDDNITQLAAKSRRKVPGSAKYQKAWRHWSTLTLQAMRRALAQILLSSTTTSSASASSSTVVDQASYQRLAFDLGVAADRGVMPSFANPGARAGYALDYFCRARLLADVFLLLLLMDDDECSYIFNPRDDNDKLLDARYHITSLGGGPGFDFVAAALVTWFQRGGGVGVSEPASGPSVGNIQTTILDYESGWQDLVAAMGTAMQMVLPQSGASCQWGGQCDITQSLYDATNAACLAQVAQTHMWTCQYCIAENAVRLRESDFVFFRDLFEAARVDSVFVFTETTPRIWPALVKVMEQHCPYMDVHLVNVRGWQMICRKKASMTATTFTLGQQDLDMLSQFERYSESNQRRIESGWIRQTAKDSQ